MHNHAIAVPDRPEAGPVSPVVTGGAWLGDEGRDQPLILQLRLPVSAEELAAALYFDDHLSPADLAADENVWAFAAVAIIQDGQNAIQARAAEILVAEARGTVGNPGWLELCRARVAEVTVPAEPTTGAVGPAPVRALTGTASPVPGQDLAMATAPPTANGNLTADSFYAGDRPPVPCPDSGRAGRGRG